MKKNELEKQKTRHKYERRSGIDLCNSLDFSSIHSQEEGLVADLEKLRDLFKKEPELFGGFEEVKNWIRQNI